MQVSMREPRPCVRPVGGGWVDGWMDGWDVCFDPSRALRVRACACILDQKVIFPSTSLAAWCGSVGQLPFRAISFVSPQMRWFDEDDVACCLIIIITNQRCSFASILRATRPRSLCLPLGLSCLVGSLMMKQIRLLVRLCQRKT